MIVKIDNILSIQEVETLNLLNVNVITLYYDMFNDIENIVNIKNICRNDIAFGIKLDFLSCNRETVQSIVDKLMPNFIQIQHNELVDENILKLLNINKINIFYERDLDCDDSTSWILPVTFDNTSEEDIIKTVQSNNINFQLNLLPNYNNSWETFKNECGKYEDDLTLKDINLFSLEYDTYLNLDFNKDNFNDIKNIFKYIKGLTFKINKNSFIESENIIDINNLKDMIGSRN